MISIELRSKPDDIGTLLHEIDESKPYTIDTIELYENNGTYTMIEASGCSCWDGDYSGWGSMTLLELQKLCRGWMEKGDSKEKLMATWVIDHFATEAEIA